MRHYAVTIDDEKMKRSEIQQVIKSMYIWVLANDLLNIFLIIKWRAEVVDFVEKN